VHVWLSPRQRTQQTFQHLFGTSSAGSNATIDVEKVTLMEDIAEWRYGDYEGLLRSEIIVQKVFVHSNLCEA
jgi:sedoheptulose-bisphosphatase